MEERLLGSEAKDDSNLKGRIWAESKKLWRIALPAMLARVSQYGMFVVTQGFIGHIGEVQLAAYALIQIIAVRFANGILLGMSSATETLCGQAFGAKQYHMMGIYLQRSWIINIATGTVLLPIFIFAGDIFKLLGEESDIASEAGYISLCLAAFVDLLPVLKLSISSGVMLCLELWYNAILVLVAGYMKNATSEISAFSICLNIISWEFMLCFGFLAGSSVRISNELGKGDAKTAKFSVKVAISTTASIGMFFFIMCLVFSHGIAKIFTSSEEVIASVSSLSVLLAFSVFLNGIQALTCKLLIAGVAVGAGRQTVVAYVNICCYYFIGIPVGIILAYVANMKVKGIWIGMLLGVVTQVLVLGYITYKTDWDQQVNEASARLNKWLLKPSDESNGS
ncbi:hypothetical protein Pint_20807 [Pistacia integerrima]|uniref:Uncharacterized protein n=1 Tax=Pistacia integerrima TaxID=434235 RepID=A0ACC0XB61_9ROSI|nr:hypothetical protein Pint_20807 [Pistacia integerrima]